MPGVLVDDALANHTPAALPASLHSAPSHPSYMRHYIPVYTSSVMSDICDEESLLSQLSPLRQPACLNATSSPDMYAEDRNLLESGLLLQFSPASTGQWACNSPSPTTRSALAALRQFLPSNFEEDEGGNVLQVQDMYTCDEFRMYEFKVRRCMRGRSHDWTECPFAHPGEKARRRDPRRFHYSGTACGDFRRGSCKKGDTCEYAHGVFECWLHPSRYRTQPCKDGQGCRRRICFFAHTPDQLRLGSPMSSPPALSSPTSLHRCGMEAFESSSPIPIRSPSKKALSESSKLPVSSSPLRRMAMETPADGGFHPAMFSPPASSQLSSTSSPMAPINWSPKGISAFALPAAAMPYELYPSLQSNQNQASLGAPVSTQCGDWERLNSIEEETNWHASGMQLPSFSEGNLMVRQSRRSVGETPIKNGCSSRASEEEILIGRFCDDEGEGEPKLERVESGKGLRAQIFQSLLRSPSQPSCRPFQDSNLEPLRSSSSLGF